MPTSTVVLINIVIEKIKRVQVQAIKVSIYVHKESASSKIALCMPQSIVLDMPPRSPKQSLFRKTYIIIGSIISAMTNIATTPHEFLIILRLVETVRNASLIEAPTMGTKLLIAKRAVFIDKRSASCVRIFLKEKININIDITNIVTEVNVFLTILETPPNSIPPRLFAQLSIIHIFTSGIIKTTRKLSVIDI